jgi:hypothetical protein
MISWSTRRTVTELGSWLALVVELGAGANVEVRVNGRLERIPARTVARVFHVRA